MFARTKRLVLRPGWAEDAQALSEAIGHEDVLRQLACAPATVDETGMREFLARTRDPRVPDFLAFARTGGAPRLVGGCGLAKAEDGIYELGYWIARPFWGLGFATEATQAVMSIARSVGLGRVRATHPLDNPASANVLRKIGFRSTGRIEQRYLRPRKSHVDCVEMEDAREAPMRNDLAAELYPDRSLVAA